MLQYSIAPAILESETLIIIILTTILSVLAHNRLYLTHLREQFHLRLVQSNLLDNLI